VLFVGLGVGAAVTFGADVGEGDVVKFVVEAVVGATVVTFPSAVDGAGVGATIGTVVGEGVTSSAAANSRERAISPTRFSSSSIATSVCLER